MIGNRRGRRSRKLLKWISRYSGYWHLICTPGDEHMNMVTARIIRKGGVRCRFGMKTADIIVY